MDECAQKWDAANYAEHARFVADLSESVVELLAPKPGERILDLGCGDGALTLRVQSSGAEVVGVDGSAEMVRAARVAGIDARHMDGQRLAFIHEFDAVFSSAAMHWMSDADAVVEGVMRALRPGGRFVGEFGGHGNVAAIVVALTAALAELGLDARASNPWYFPTAQEYAEKLEAHGFAIDSIGLIPRPTVLPTDMAGWLDTFANPFFSGLLPDRRLRARDRVVELLRGALCDRNGRWTADYVRLRFAARVTE